MSDRRKLVIKERLAALYENIFATNRNYDFKFTSADNGFQIQIMHKNVSKHLNQMLGIAGNVNNNEFIYTNIQYGGYTDVDAYTYTDMTYADINTIARLSGDEDFHVFSNRCIISINK